MQEAEGQQAGKQFPVAAPAVVFSAEDNCVHVYYQ